MARFDVSNAEWSMIEPFLPVAATGPLPRQERALFNGVMWRFRNGCGWREVPERYGSWSTVYGRFRTWAKAGVFEALMDGLIAEAASRGQAGLELVSVDSTVVRAHHDASGLAVSGEVLDALEAAVTEEKGVPLDQQQSVRLRVARVRRTSPTRASRATIRRSTSAGSAGAARPGPRPPGSDAPAGA